MTAAGFRSGLLAGTARPLYPRPGTQPSVSTRRVDGSTDRRVGVGRWFSEGSGFDDGQSTRRVDIPRMRQIRKSATLAKLGIIDSTRISFSITRITRRTVSSISRAEITLASVKPVLRVSVIIVLLRNWERNRSLIMTFINRTCRRRQ